MSNLDYTEWVRNHLNLVTGFTRYTHAHYMPHVEHVESCRSDEMAKHGRDVVWSLLIATSCCPPSFVFYLFVEQSELLSADVKLSPLPVILLSMLSS